ncbi:MAG: hypothetical protein B7O98_05560 [Zestosphaera tikiterensis]|uniref:Phosphomevalonate dehydratase small subunit-like domain-containing protein n=1 Tax=Zestosphaera tikiterensis TaxID=1973259 RepID=A0A2R7Y3L1_9CREN|nr:MAG: hypothetical protein B7O98_05560 [Zestosphaera tikiterensis]
MLKFKVIWDLRWVGMDIPVSKVFSESEVCGVLRVSKKPLSFLGDVDVDKAEVKGLGSIGGVILAVHAFVGSTVGPYVLFSLMKRGSLPKALITTAVDPTILAGCVLTGLPLYKVNPKDLELLIKYDGCNVCLQGGKLTILDSAGECLE